LSGSTPAGAADVIVVAAGRSARMGGADKLAIEVGGRPLLAWTLAALGATPVVGRMVVVTAGERIAEVAAADWLPESVADVVAGGSRRQESVAAGFAALDRRGAEDSGVVLVHDAYSRLGISSVAADGKVWRVSGKVDASGQADVSANVLRAGTTLVFAVAGTDAPVVTGR